VAAGATAERVADRMGIALRTLQRWRRQFAGDGCHRLVSHRLTEEERTKILRTSNQPQYAALPPGQIVPDLADQGSYRHLRAAFTGCSMPMAKPTAVDGPGRLRSPGKCHD